MTLELKRSAGTGAGLRVRAKGERTASSSKGRRLLCRACGQPVTTEGDRIVVAGSHLHRRANPAGFTFEFGCFQEAGGAVAVGTPTSEHTWFPGHSWSFAMCRRCGEQLGWRFEDGDPERFHGLICDRLEVEDQSSP